MRSLLVAGLVLVTAACGTYQFPGASPSPAANSARVSGTVLSVPCSPVEPAARTCAVPCSPMESADMTCAGRPVPDLEIDYLKGSNVVARAVTNSSGVYVIDLAPGRYDVALQTYLRVISGPTRLSLAEGTKTVADYVLDNGIRAPVPQQ